ncbi:MAG: PilZ domain-containing protein [Methylomonas sp.]|jgi:hypothetical protein
MTDIDSSGNLFEALDKAIPIDILIANKRYAVRYQRRDIKAVIKIGNLILPRLVPVILEDISSRGAGIRCPKKLGRSKNLYLYLLFADGVRFDLNVTVAYCHKNYKYGLKFDRYNKRLGDHILKTQTDLEFK